MSTIEAPSSDPFLEAVRELFGAVRRAIDEWIGRELRQFMLALDQVFIVLHEAEVRLYVALPWWKRIVRWPSHWKSRRDYEGHRKMMRVYENASDP